MGLLTGLTADILVKLYPHKPYNYHYQRLVAENEQTLLILYSAYISKHLEFKADRIKNINAWGQKLFAEKT